MGARNAATAPRCDSRHVGTGRDRVSRHQAIAGRSWRGARARRQLAVTERTKRKAAAGRDGAAGLVKGLLWAPVVRTESDLPWPWLLLVEEDSACLKASLLSVVPSAETTDTVDRASTTVSKPYETWVRLMVPDKWGWICVSEQKDLVDVTGDARPLATIAEEIARPSPPKEDATFETDEEKLSPAEKLQRKWLERLLL